MSIDVDVAIIGGGPAGSTCASLLKKYRPDLRVLVLERERFPRDHIGESQLPIICDVLDEMGAWDKIEAANFPIKVGATYRWGRTDELWDFEFVPGVSFDHVPRPGKYAGQRRHTAFQVDRSVYDTILLDHAAELGADVRQEVKVLEVASSGDEVQSLRLATGDTVHAKYFVDASGASAILRRAMGVEIEAPTQLRNIAIWDYWQNADWAVRIGIGGTRIQIMSLGWGWIWFIPIGETRTSVGLVVPATTYKESGKKPLELYLAALQQESQIAQLLTHARREEKLATTNDWSFVTSRAAGRNWFLTGDACGFADPILSAGMTLAHTGAREVAYAILELERGEHDPEWLRSRYEETQLARIRSHIKFADFWYSGDGTFPDVKANVSNIAADAGLILNAEDAFRWLSTGGFAHDTILEAQVGTWDVTAIKMLSQRFAEGRAGWSISRNNIFELRLEGSEKAFLPALREGRIQKVRCFQRDGKTLPNSGDFRMVIHSLRLEREAAPFLKTLVSYMQQQGLPPDRLPYILQALEAMIAEGWVEASLDPHQPCMQIETPDETDLVHANRDPAMAIA